MLYWQYNLLPVRVRALHLVGMGAHAFYGGACLHWGQRVCGISRVEQDSLLIPCCT